MIKLQICRYAGALKIKVCHFAAEALHTANEFSSSWVTEGKIKRLPYLA